MEKVGIRYSAITTEHKEESGGLQLRDIGCSVRDMYDGISEKTVVECIERETERRKMKESYKRVSIRHGVLSC